MATSFGGAVNIVARPNLCEKLPFPKIEPEEGPAAPFLGEGLKGLRSGILDPNPPTLSLPSLLVVKPAVVVEVVCMLLIMLLSSFATPDVVLRG
jgi:hypothetical protein